MNTRMSRGRAAAMAGNNPEWDAWYQALLEASGGDPVKVKFGGNPTAARTAAPSAPTAGAAVPSIQPRQPTERPPIDVTPPDAPRVVPPSMASLLAPDDGEEVNGTYAPPRARPLPPSLAALARAGGKPQTVQQLQRTMARRRRK